MRNALNSSDKRCYSVKVKKDTTSMYSNFKTDYFSECVSLHLYQANSCCWINQVRRTSQPILERNSVEVGMDTFTPLVILVMTVPFLTVQISGSKLGSGEQLKLLGQFTLWTPTVVGHSKNRGFHLQEPNNAWHWYKELFTPLYLTKYPASFNWNIQDLFQCGFYD